MKSPGSNYRPKMLASGPRNQASVARRYCVVTPCRNESEFAARTLASVTNQTIPPATWVIVDDGSSDDSRSIVEAWQARFPNIHVVLLEDRGFRKLGSGVISAFNRGLQEVSLSDYEYICKLDLDIELPTDYFELLIQRMEADPRIGTCSGKPYYRTGNGRLIAEDCGDEHSVGMVKLYRRDCFLDIGGFVPELMWDGIDGHRCRMLGWIAVSWDDPELRFEHLRPMGSSDRNRWIGRMRHGRGQYFMGTSLPYILASSLFRMTRRPPVVGGLAILWGYLAAALRGLPRYDNPEFRRFLRAFQWRCLLTGKARAVQHTNQVMEPHWRHRNRKPNRQQRSAVSSASVR